MSTGGIILSLVAGAFIIIILGVPVYASLGLIGTISLVVLTVTKGTPLSWIVVPSSIYNGATQITLLAIPFYVFAGEMMNKGGITKKLVNFALLLIMGMFMDGSAAVILLAPILAPIAFTLGISTIHFGVIMVLNLIIGCGTPPLGACLFIASKVAGVPVERGVRGMVPYLVAEFIVLMLVTYIPAVVTWFPTLMGYSV